MYTYLLVPLLNGWKTTVEIETDFFFFSGSSGSGIGITWEQKMKVVPTNSNQIKNQINEDTKGLEEETIWKSHAFSFLNGNIIRWLQLSRRRSSLPLQNGKFQILSSNFHVKCISAERERERVCGEYLYIYRYISGNKRGMETKEEN